MLTFNDVIKDSIVIVFLIIAISFFYPDIFKIYGCKYIGQVLVLK